jgi:PPE-repeat protein
MASPPEVHSALLSAGPGEGPLLASAAAWSSLSAEYTAAAEELTGLLDSVQAGVWRGPSAEQYAAAHLPYLAWLTQAGADSAGTAARHETAAAAYSTALAAMPTLAELAANHATHAVLVATNFFGINTIPIALNEADYARMWIQAATTMDVYQAVSDAAVASQPHTSAAPQILNHDHTEDPWDQYTNPSGPMYWVARVEELSSQFQTFGKELLTNPAQAFSYLVQLMLFDWPTHIAQIATWLAQSPQLLSVALSLTVANLGWAAGGLAGLAGLGGPAQPVTAPGGPVAEPGIGEPTKLPTAAIAPTTPLAGPAAPALAPASAPAVPAPAAAPAAAPTPMSGVSGFGYLAGGGGPGTRFGPTHRVRSSAEASVSETAAAPGTAARAWSREQVRVRRRRRAAMQDFADEFMDLSADATAGPADGNRDAVAASESGAGAMGFSGTANKPQVAVAAGLARLAGDGFGGGPQAPMLPETWGDGESE